MLHRDETTTSHVFQHISIVMLAVDQYPTEKITQQIK